jgi:PleD family two-component response regulator
MLNEQSFDAPVIHVVSESPRLEMLQSRLRQAGIRPVPARGSYLPPDSAPVFIDLITRAIDLPNDDLRMVITLGRETKANDRSNIHLTDIAQIASLPARISIRQREQQRRREIKLRARTLSYFDSEKPPRQAVQRERLLWLGNDAPFLNALKSTLNDGDISLVAAISSLTAEDYLESGRFKTLALCPTTPDDEAAKLLARIKRLPLVRAPQVVLLIRPELSAKMDREALTQADQILDLTEDFDVVATRLRALSEAPELCDPNPLEIASTAQDMATGLVSRDYLEKHLQGQIEQADQWAQPLSVISIELKDDDDPKFVARKIKALLRDTDLAARLDPKHICITLPDTAYRGGVVLARRIEEALERSVNWRVIERRQFHTLKSLLGGLTARSGLSSQRIA